LKHFLIALDRFLGQAMKWFSITCLVILAVVLTGVVFVRFVPVARLSWSDEVVEWAFAWMVFFGAASIWRQDAHFRVDALIERVETKKPGRVLKLFIALSCTVFFVLFTYYGSLLTWNANDRSPILEWPRPLWYSCMPLSGAIMTVYALRNVMRSLSELIEPDRARRAAPEFDIAEEKQET
jgi:TRAP-type C4-dicarboxylate transport system permease small subunit